MGQSSLVTVEVVSPDLEFIRALRVEPLEDAGGRLTPGTPTRMPGAVDTLGQIMAHADNLATGTLGSLVATWIWQARRKSGPKHRVRVTISRLGRRIDIDIEGETEAQTASLLKAALEHAAADR